MKERMEKVETIGFVVPINFAHKAGDGTKTRTHSLSKIHPSLQANVGNSQQTYLLELWRKE